MQVPKPFRSTQEGSYKGDILAPQGLVAKFCIRWKESVVEAERSTVNRCRPLNLVPEGWAALLEKTISGNGYW